MEGSRKHARRSRRHAGFTLMEVMIVVLVIAILVEMAAPQFITARYRARQRTCMSNLRGIEYAKEQLAGAQRLADGDPVVMADLAPDYITTVPVCPGGGVYDVQVVGQSPECSLNTGNFAHIAP